MRNIELKAALGDRGRAVQVCQELGASHEGDIHQIDTYFAVPQGRLKLRESDPGDDYLVHYERPDVAEARACDYTISIVPRSVKSFLGKVLGVIAEVDKIRTLYLWENVRIHLDTVVGLGEFIEFEAVLSEKYHDADGHAELARLLDAFAIADSDILDCSYLDLVTRR
ncbi:MAG: class IV adenylate cyclase [bacterium]|nr:class IV adenylate cyclase [bacterium]